MAVGSIPKSSALSFTLVSSKDDDKKDPKQGTQDFGPSGVAAYGSGKAVYSTETRVAELQKDSATFDNAAGTGAYAGETTALEARARWNESTDVTGKTGLGIDGQAQANLFRSDQGVDYKTQVLKYADHDLLWADAHANGGALVGAQVDGSVNLNLSFSSAAGFKGRVGAFAGALVRGEAEARGYLGGASVGVHARGEAWAGAQAWAEASVGAKGIKASAGAFAGAAAGGAVGADVMGIGVEAGGSVWAGAGAKASFGVGWKDGKITVGADAGAALGVGAEGEINLTIDTNRLVGDAEAAWNTATGIAGQAEKDAGDAFNNMAKAVGDAAKQAGDTVGAAAGAVGQAAEGVGQAIEQGADDAGQVVSDVWNWLTGNG
jgi:hypothetical protein